MLRRFKAHVTACLVHLCVEGPSGFATFSPRAFAFPATYDVICHIRAPPLQVPLGGAALDWKEDRLQVRLDSIAQRSIVCMQRGSDDQPIFQHLN